MSYKHQHAAFHDIIKERRWQFGLDIFPTNLKALCVQSIWKHSNLFLQVEQRTGSNPFDVLSNSLKTDVLNQKPHWQWDRFQEPLILLLANKNVTKLSFSMCPDDDRLSFMSFWSTMLTHPFQLVELNWNDGLWSTWCEGTFVVNFITTHQNFSSLQSLKLGSFCCRDIELQAIASHLKNLRVLKLQMDKTVSAAGISALSSLQNLLEFAYEIDFEEDGYNDTREEEILLYNLSLQLLPKLLVNGAEMFILESLNYGTISDNFTELAIFDIRFESFPNAFELGLQQLVLDRHVDYIPPDFNMPNLTSLCFWYNRWANLQLLDHQIFSKVTELALVESGMDIIRGTLNILGHQIQKLAILDSSLNFKLDQILTRCPNLKEFHIGLCPRKIEYNLTMDPEIHLQQLTMLKIDMSKTGAVLDPGALLKLFSAPNLRQIKLLLIDIPEEEANSIVRLLDMGQILQKLEKIELTYFPLFATVGRSLALRKRCELLMNCMARNCPLLVHLHLGK